MRPLLFVIILCLVSCNNSQSYTFDAIKYDYSEVKEPLLRPKHIDLFNSLSDICRFNDQEHYDKLDRRLVLFYAQIVDKKEKYLLGEQYLLVNTFLPEFPLTNSLKVYIRDSYEFSSLEIGRKYHFTGLFKFVNVEENYCEVENNMYTTFQINDVIVLKDVSDN